MSHIQDPPKPFFSFGSPFCMISSKGSYLSPKLLDLLNRFEDTLCNRLKKLKPVVEKDIHSLCWMRRATQSLSAIHADIKALITSLELPVSDWDENWIGFYLDDSIRLMDICIAFSSEISQLKQAHLFLQSILHDSTRASLINEWRQHITEKNPRLRLDSRYAAIDNLSKMVELRKVKKSAKSKVVMRAMYGVKVVTLFIVKVFASAFSGSAKNLIDIHVSETYIWAEAFTDLQILVNRQIRKQISGTKLTFLEEIEDVDKALRNFHHGLEHYEETQKLEKLLAKSSGCLDLLKKDVDDLFRVILTGRDALLGNLRVSNDDISDEMLKAR